MRLEQLEYLVVISKCKSLSEASKRLFITQQSLGKSITNLEKELGVTLLTRASRGCYLTKEGLETLEAAKKHLTASKPAERALQRMPGNNRRHHGALLPRRARDGAFRRPRRTVASRAAHERHGFGKG